MLKSWNHHCVKSVQIRSFFWSVFSRIRTEYGEMRSISPYSDRMRENMDKKKLRIWTLFTQCARAASLTLRKVMMELSKAIYWPKNGKWKMRGSVLYKWLMNWILISYLMINLSCFLINTHPHGIFRGHLYYSFQNVGKWTLVNRSKNTRPRRISWDA